MSRTKRIYKIVVGIVMIICSILLFEYPNEGYYFIVLVLDITLLLYGFKLLIYYFTMARYMVGGLMTLYKSIILIDFGLFVFNMTDVPKKMTMLYLSAIMAFDGITDCLQAMDSRRHKLSAWKYEMAIGIIKNAIAVGCLFFMDSIRIAAYLYCIGLLHSAISNIITALRDTAMVYAE